MTWRYAKKNDPRVAERRKKGETPRQIVDALRDLTGTIISLPIHGQLTATHNRGWNRSNYTPHAEPISELRQKGFSISQIVDELNKRGLSFVAKKATLAQWLASYEKREPKRKAEIARLSVILRMIKAQNPGQTTDFVRSSDDTLVSLPSHAPLTATPTHVWSRSNYMLHAELIIEWRIQGFSLSQIVSKLNKHELQFVAKKPTLAQWLARLEKRAAKWDIEMTQRDSNPGCLKFKSTVPARAKQGSISAVTKLYNSTTASAPISIIQGRT